MHRLGPGDGQAGPCRADTPTPMETGDAMPQDDCVFCKIVKGELPCARVFETDDVLAFLDIAPVAPGQCPGHSQGPPPQTCSNAEAVGGRLFAALSPVGAAVMAATGAAVAQRADHTTTPPPARCLPRPAHLIPGRGDGCGCGPAAPMPTPRRPGMAEAVRAADRQGRCPVGAGADGACGSPEPLSQENAMNGKTLTQADIVDYIYEKTERTGPRSRCWWTT